jgi:hypothetical protein
MTPLGIVLRVVGLAFVGLGIAGRIKAAQLVRPLQSDGPLSLATCSMRPGGYTSYPITAGT